LTNIFIAAEDVKPTDVQKASKLTLSVSLTRAVIVESAIMYYLLLINNTTKAVQKQHKDDYRATIDTNSISA
jgi:hypothetical protein